MTPIEMDRLIQAVVRGKLGEGKPKQRGSKSK